MNQVLDFSNVVTLENNSWRQVKQTHHSRRDLKDGTEHLAALLDSYALEDIAVLAEDAVEGVCLGHLYGRTISSRNARHTSSVSPSDIDIEETQPSDVEIIVDIAPGDWIYKTQPSALRRIIVDVFGNAVKCTDRGRVSLQLKTVFNPELHFDEQDPGQLVMLTVSDTSKGISEGTLAGPGLSIVRTLVKSLDGHITIRSRENEGTVVKVSLPLERGPQSETFTDADILRQRYGKKSVAMLGFNPDATEKRPALWRVLERYLTEWFGLELVSWPSCGPVDILLADENDLDCYNKYLFTNCPSAILVLCNSAMDHRAYRHSWHPPADVVDFIHRPLGPHKLAKKIHGCMQRLPVPAASPSRLPGRHPALADSRRVTLQPFDCPDELLETPDIEAELFPGFIDNEQSTSTETSTADSPLTPEEQPTGLRPFPRQGPSRRQSAPAASMYNQPIVSPELPSIKKRPGSPPKPQMLKVLVVDDNEINLQVMVTFMRRRNLSVLESAENGKVAVDAVERQGGYDIIFMGW